jgi:Arc/MetJ-type ribon-helix-helix transcriptional regulator
MTITLKPEQERIIQTEIQSGHFSSTDEVLDHALAAVQEKAPRRKTAAPRKAKILAWRLARLEGSKVGINAPVAAGSYLPASKVHPFRASRS